MKNSTDTPVTERLKELIELIDGAYGLDYRLSEVINELKELQENIIGVAAHDDILYAINMLQSIRQSLGKAMH